MVRKQSIWYMLLRHINSKKIEIRDWRLERLEVFSFSLLLAYTIKTGNEG